MMKKCISYWSFEGGLEGEKDIGECFHEAKEAGYDAVELAVAESGELTTETREQECKEILKKAGDAGIEVSSLATGLFWDYSLTDDDPQIAEKAQGVVRKMLQIAAWLELDTILVVPGAVHVFFLPDSQPLRYDIVYERSKKALEELVPAAEKLQVAIGIENVWNKSLLRPLEMRDFVDQFGSDYLGVYFDVGNVLLFGYPEHWIEILGHRIKKVHLKDFKTSLGTAEGFCDLTEGDVNWKAVMQSLGNIGYDSYLTAEMVPPTPGIVQKTSPAIDTIMSYGGGEKNVD